MKKPLILFTTSTVHSDAQGAITGDTDILYSDQASAEAIVQAGGLPLYLPSVDTLNEEDLQQYLALADGLFITGADTNTNPSYYGEDQADYFSGRIDDDRDRIDIALIKQAYKLQMPILGGCKGMQIINVALGGTLYQDVSRRIPRSELHNQNGKRFSFTHEAIVVPDTLLATVFNTPVLRLNGGHQQAVDTLAEPLVGSALAADGIIEAYEGRDYPFLLGVQFHPELRLAEDGYKQLFDHFIRQAGA